MAYDARLAEVDVLDPNFKPSQAQLAEYSRLKAVYRSLPPEVQKVYQDIRKEYTDAINEYEKILLRSVTPSLAAKLKAEYQARKRVVAYIPFLRRGDFWVEYEDPAAGERAVSAFQSERQRQQFINTVIKKGKHKVYSRLEDISYSGTIS